MDKDILPLHAPDPQSAQQCIGCPGARAQPCLKEERCLNTHIEREEEEERNLLAVFFPGERALFLCCLYYVRMGCCFVCVY
jgi:hypothetical protein